MILTDHHVPGHKAPLVHEPLIAIFFGVMHSMLDEMLKQLVDDISYRQASSSVMTSCSVGPTPTFCFVIEPPHDAIAANRVVKRDS